MMRGIALNRGAKLNIKGVDVDFIANYKYPFFLNRYRGYVLKEVDCIGEKEIFESKVLIRIGYLPIYIVKCNSSKYTINKLENEKMPFNLKAMNLEIEKSVLDIKKFKGSVILNIAEDGSTKNMVFCSSYSLVGDKAFIKGISGNLDSCVKNSLVYYNRRIG